MDKISVAMICQDEEEVLPVTLECLVPLANILKEVAIVDGYSKDRTMNVVHEFMGRLPIVTLVHEFDTFRAQKNRALDMCTGEWVLGLDADMAFNSLLFHDLFVYNDYFGEHPVWDFHLYYCKGDMKHYDISSTGNMATTRLWRNCGLRYTRDVHEYLVFPGEEGWESIHHKDRLRVTDKLAILELSELKSAAGMRNRVARYKQWAERSLDAGIPIDKMEAATEGIISDPWGEVSSIPENILDGVPEKCFEYPLAKGELK